VPKRRQIISLADVPTVFDDPCIRKLAANAKLPAESDLEAFGWWIREAAEMFVREVQVPTANEVRSEISALYKAAAQRDFERAASLLGSLSQGALALFEEPPLALEIKANSQCAVAKTSRAERVRSRKTRQSARPLPSPSELRDDASRDQACATIEGLCRIGGQLVEGRRRPLGKRSRANFRPHLFAPSAIRHFPKRDAERRFVWRLSLAWCEATGKQSPRTARRATAGRDIGPFARLVRECLRLAGARYADPVALINEMGASHERRDDDHVKQQPVTDGIRHRN
jgi:hypothetical protein